MRSTGIDPNELDLLSLGFMVNGAKNGLTSLLLGQKVLIPYEQGSLRGAAEFLTEVASGADFIENDHMREGFSSMHALTALRYALGPRDSVRKLIGGADIVAYFSALEVAVARAADGRIEEANRADVENALKFFEFFYPWIMGKLKACNPILGSRHASASMLSTW